MTFNLFVQLLLFSVGMTYIISGSKIGFPLRFVWCFVLQKKPIDYFWSVITCPPCNAFWTGLAAGYFTTWSIVHSIQLAVTSCGVMAIVQAVSLGIGMQGDEDFHKIIHGDEEED